MYKINRHDDDSSDAYSFVACVKDDALDDWEASEDDMTPEDCSEICMADGYQYFGLKNSRECWCGDSAGTRVAASECFLGCKGDMELLCGSPSRLSAYKHEITLSNDDSAPDAYEYIGCISTDTANYHLDVVGYEDYEYNTPAWCAQTCKDLYYR